MTLSKMPGMRERQRLATRAQILEAAISLFAARGFDGTTLPAIAAHCGVPVPLMIYHFKSKDQLWRASVGEVYAKVEAYLATQQAGILEASGAQFYRRCARAHVTALALYPEYMRILFQEGTQESDRLAWLVETHQSRMSAMLKAIIARAQMEGLVPAMNLDDAKFIFSGAFSLAIILAPEYRIATGNDSRSTDFIDRHIDACLGLLLPGIDWHADENR